jgi:hypothetical protein
MFHIKTKTFTKHKKMILVVVFLLIILLVYIIYNTYVSSISLEDEKYMRNFVIYRDKLFEIYGILSVIKLAFTNYDNNFDNFSTFFNKISYIFEYKYGDKVMLDIGQVEFKTQILQYKIDKTQSNQTYMLVTLPLNNEYYIKFYRLIHYIDIPSINMKASINEQVYENNYETNSENNYETKSENNYETNSENIMRMIQNNKKLSHECKTLLLHLHKTELKTNFMIATGFVYILLHFVEKYNNFQKAFHIIKTYNKILVSSNGEGIFIWENTSGNFSFENDNKNYEYEQYAWVNIYNTNVASYTDFIGKSSHDGNIFLKEICRKVNIRCDLVENVNLWVDTVIDSNQNDNNLRHKNNKDKYKLAAYPWFNNTLMLPTKKESVIVGYKNYLWGSGYNYEI